MADGLPLTSTPVKWERLPAVRTEGEAAAPLSGKESSNQPPPPVSLAVAEGLTHPSQCFAHQRLWVSSASPAMLYSDRDRGATWGVPQRMRVEANRLTPGASEARSLVSPPQDRTCRPRADSGRSVGRAVRGSSGGAGDTPSLRATAMAPTPDPRALCLYSSLPGL